MMQRWRDYGKNQEQLNLCSDIPPRATNLFSDIPQA